MNLKVRSTQHAEMRRHPRWSADLATFRVHCADTGDEARLVDFSQVGMGLVLAGTAPVVGEEVSVLLARAERSFLRLRVGVATGSQSREGVRIGGPILECMPIPFGPEPRRGEGDFAEIRDARLLGDLFERLASKQPPMRVHTDVGRYPARLDPSRTRGNVLGLVIEEGSVIAGEGRSLSFELDGGAFALRGRLVHHDGACFTFEGPFVVTSRGRRLTDRVRLVPGTGRVSWQHALVPGTRVFADVEDISPGGARVRVKKSDSSIPPPPGDPVVLHLEGFAFPTLADVRHIDAEADGTMTFGLRFAPKTADESISLGRKIEGIRFPGLQSRHERSRDEVASLFHASGYLDLRESARALVPWHDAADAGLSIDTVHARPDGQIDGHLSTLRVYSNTWVFHQLATLAGPFAAQCRRALYLSASGWVSLLAEGKGYTMAYFDRSKRWHALFFEAFTRWAGSDSLALITPLDRFELAAGGEPQDHAAWDVGEAHEDELPEILRRIETTLPPLLREATELREGSLVSPVLCAPHTAEGLPRNRTVLVVRDRTADRKIAAVALCEVGSASLSLFNLLNMAHLVVEKGAPVEAQRALLDRVKGFYAERGTLDPILVAIPGTLTGAEAAGLTLVETMGCMVMSPEGFKQYRNFLAYSLRADKT